jgi:hypothetical protein
MTKPDPSRARQIINLSVDGQRFEPTNRFVDSLSGLLGQSRSVYRLFEPEEVISRAQERGINPRIQVSSVQKTDGTREILAAVPRSKSIIDPIKYGEVLVRAGVDPENVGYHNGIITSNHQPVIPSAFAIGGQEMMNIFLMSMPLDGYGKPDAFLGFIRMICQNLGIMMDQVFRTSISTGKNKEEEVRIDTMPQIERFFEAFNNEEGFTAIQQRLEVAHRTTASLNEFQQVWNAIKGGKRNEDGEGDDGSNFISDTSPYSAYEIRNNLSDAAAGGSSSIAAFYGIGSLEQLNDKRRRVLRTFMSVYDLVNFATETATHHCTENGKRAVGSVVGKIIAKEYDLEGDKPFIYDGEPRALFLNN